MRTFISHLLSGASARVEETHYHKDQYGNNVVELPAASAIPPPPAPKDFVKARSLLSTAITRLASRRDVLVQEIEDRSAELYETNRTLEALSAAEHSIYEIGKAPPTDAEPEPMADTERDIPGLAEAIAGMPLGDTGLPETEFASLPGEDLYDKVMRQSVTSGLLKPRGFA